MSRKAGRIPSLYTVILIAIFLFSAAVLSAQESEEAASPRYSFVSFDSSYDQVERNARREGYEVLEEESISRYGRFSLTLDRAGKFYGETIYLFFDDARRLIFFSVSLDLNENQSKLIIDRLVTEIVKKFEDQYGESEKETVPYYRIPEGRYEIFVKPVTATTVSCVVTFRHIGRFDEYGEFYSAEVIREVSEEIEKTLEYF